MQIGVGELNHHVIVLFGPRRLAVGFPDPAGQLDAFPVGMVDAERDRLLRLLFGLVWRCGELADRRFDPAAFILVL